VEKRSVGKQGKKHWWGGKKDELVTRGKGKVKHGNEGEMGQIQTHGGVKKRRRKMITTCKYFREKKHQLYENPKDGGWNMGGRFSFAGGK